MAAVPALRCSAAARFAAGHMAHYSASRASLSHRGPRRSAMRKPYGLSAGRIADAIDHVTATVGRAAVWCCLYAVLAEFAVVLMRYALGIGSIKLQESVLYAHAGLFMLAAAWTL